MNNLWFVLLLCPLLCIGQSEHKPLPPNKEAIIDSLSNGLQYIIHPIAGDKVEFRLLINAGSLQELPEERGAAHFLEHMLFQHSEDFPNGKIVDSIRTSGYVFGRDINAYTNYDRTQFEISFLNNNQQHLALHILRNILAKAEFREQDLQKERRIITQEIRDYGPEKLFTKVKLAGSSYVDRMPLGTEADIQKLTVKALAAFYKKWYSPANATLIVTGDVNLAQVIAAINKLYAEIPRAKYANRRQHMDSFHPNYTQQFYQEEDLKRATNRLEIIQFASTNKLENEADFKNQLIEQLYKAFIYQKIAQSKSKAQYHSSWYLPQQNEHSFAIAGKSEEALLDQLSQLASFISTLHTIGISATELENLKTAHLKRLAAAPQQLAAATLANYYVDQVAVGHQYIHPRDELALTNQILPEITAADFQQLHQKIWFSNPNKRLFLLSYSPALFQFSGIKKLDAAWEKGLHTRLNFSKKTKTPTDTSAKKTHHWSQLPAIPLPTQAYIKQEVYYPTIDATEITLSNGLRIAIRPTSDKHQNIVCSFATRGGLEMVPDPLFPYFQDASYFIGESWIKGLSQDEARDFESQKEISSLVSISGHATVLNTLSNRADLDDALQWTYRKLYAYEKPKADFKAYIKAEIAKAKIKQGKSDTAPYPSFDLEQKINAYKAQSRRFRGLQTEEEWKAVNLDHIFELYELQVSKANEAYILIAGPVEVAEVKQKALRYFGQIPPLASAKKPNTLAEAIEKRAYGITNPLKKEKTNSYTALDQNEETERVAAALIFKGKIEPNLKAYFIAQLLNEHFKNNFMEHSREKKGLLYSPYFSLEVHLYPRPKTCLTINFTAQKSDIALLEELAARLAQKLQTVAIDPQTLAALKTTILHNEMALLKDASPMVWVNSLRENYLNYGSISDLNAAAYILESITATDVKQVAETMFPIDQPAKLILDKEN